MSSPKPNVGRPLGPMSFNHVDGGTRSIGEGGDRWSVLFVYRGKHCPRCKRYLNKLEAALPAWQEHMIPKGAVSDSFVLSGIPLAALI